jgi:hypothetical protein
MPKATKLVKVATKLEHELLAAIVKGAASPSIVDPKELSKIGRIVHNAIVQLSQNGLTAPFKLTTVFTHCISNLGAPEQDLRMFLNTVSSIAGSKDQKVLLKVAKQKETLVGILNEASKQLGSGTVELRKFNEIVEKNREAGDVPKPLAETHKDYDGEPEQGIMCESLPTIMSVSRGVQGVWIIGAMEGVGKSTLGLQLAIEVQEKIPVLYYDVDGTGEQWVCYRVTQAVGKGQFEEATKNLYYRPSIASLDADLLAYKAPAMIVIDSIQTLPYEAKHRRSSVDSWLNTFKALTNKGYTVLVISELSREGQYKESSGINYAGALNAELEEVEPGVEGSDIRFIVKKNRHGPRKGHIATLTRNQQCPFWLEEI